MRTGCTKSQQGAEVILELLKSMCVIAESFLQTVRVHLQPKSNLAQHQIDIYLIAS
jgi:hypothetical protein